MIAGTMLQWGRAHKDAEGLVAAAALIYVVRLQWGRAHKDAEGYEH